MSARRSGNHRRNTSNTFAGRRLWFLLVGIVLLTVVGVALFRGLGPAGDRTADAVLGLHRLAAGQRHTYDLDYHSRSVADLGAVLGESSLNDEGDAGGLQRFDVHVRGDLQLSVADARPDSARLHMRITDVRAEVVWGDQADATFPAALRRELDRPAMISLDRTGRVKGIVFEPQVSPIAVGVIRAVLSTVQLVQEDGSSLSDSWEVVEESPNALCEVHYERVAANDGAKPAGDSVVTYRKTRVRFLQPPSSATASGAPQAAVTMRPGGRIEARVDPSNRRLLSVRAEETQTVFLTDRQLARTESTLRLTHVRSEPLAADEPAQLAAAVRRADQARRWEGLLAVPDARAQEESIQRSELGDDTLETLLERLFAAELAAEQDADATSLVLKFRALAYLRPELCPVLAGIIVEAPAEGLVLPVLVQALGAAGTPEAQAALADVIDARRDDWPALAVLLPTLGQVGAPTPRAESALADLAAHSQDWNTRTTTELALGNMARQLSVTAPTRADAIVRRFMKRAESAPDDQELQQALLVLGNTASADLLPLAERRLRHASPSVRAAAAWALRWLDGDRPEELLISAMSEDTEAVVRNESVAALARRPMNDTTYQAQVQALAAEQDPDVRLNLLRNLWTARRDFPQAIEQVRHAAEHDAAPTVRQAAEEILAAEVRR